MDSLVSWDFMTLGFVAYKQRLLAAQVSYQTMYSSFSISSAKVIKYTNAIKKNKVM